MERHYVDDLSREDFLKFKTPNELHDLVGRCRFYIQEWIVDSPLCSEATALFIFWDNSPTDFLNYSWKARTGSRIEDFNMIRTIVNNFEKGFYLKTDIIYNPSEVISKTKFIPQVVLQVCKGEEPYTYIDKKEIHSWFGDYLENKIDQCDSTIELYNIAVSLKHRDVSVYEKVIDHPFCDKAIAIMVYWLLEKYSNFTIYAEEWLIIKPILEKVVQKLQDNAYPEVLAYDVNKEVKPVKWKIPEYMFHPLSQL